MTDHIDTSALESVVLAPESVGKTELARIQQHVQSCALCREQMETLKLMYGMVEKELKDPPTERDRQLAERIIPRGLVRTNPEERIIEAYGDLVEPYRTPFAGQLRKYIRVHPYQSSGALVFVAATMALLFSILLPSKDQNPKFAEVKNYVLYAYNKEAEVLWKRGVPGVPDWSSQSSPIRDANYPKRHLLVEDIDGDGLNEVLFVGTSLSGEFTGDTLYCFDQRGGFAGRQEVAQWSRSVNRS